MTSKGKLLVVIFLASAGIVIVLACAILYFTSDRYAFSCAEDCCKGGEYRGALAILDSLSPEYRDSSTAIAMRGSCQYNLARELCALGEYEESRNLLAALPDLKDLDGNSIGGSRLLAGSLIWVSK